VRAAIGNSARLSSSFQPASAGETPSPFCWSNSPVSSSGTSHSSIPVVSLLVNLDDCNIDGLLCRLSSCSKNEKSNNKRHPPCCCLLSKQESITNSPRRKGLKNNNLQTLTMSG